MPIESGNYISDFVTSYPQGSDDRSTSDDHHRLIKTFVKNSFPNINGAVNANPGELNILSGATISTAQLNRLGGLTGATGRVVLTDSSGNLVEQAAIAADRALVSDSGGLPVASGVTATELGYLSGVKSGVQGQIDGMADRIGAGNLLANGSFEVDSDGDGVPDGWNFSPANGATITLDTSYKLGGRNSVSITSTSTSDGGGNVETDFIPVVPGRTYVLRGRFVANGSGVPGNAVIYWYDSAGGSISSSVGSVADVGTSPRDIEVTGTAPSNAVWARLALRHASGGASTGTLWVDHAEFWELDSIHLLPGIAPTAASTYIAARFGENSSGYAVSSSYYVNTYVGGNLLRFYIKRSGAVRVYFQFRSSWNIKLAQVQVVMNGSGVGSFGTSSTSFVARSVDLTVSRGDYIYFQQAIQDGVTNGCIIRYMRIYSGTPSDCAEVVVS